MKSKFNYSLFKDGFKQLRAIGVMAFIIYSIEAFFVVLFAQLNKVEYYKNVALYGYPPTVYEDIAIQNLLDLHPILIATCYVVVPLMLLYLFSFLNKRNTSDFYHSIPVKRECLCISYLASILAWILLIVCGSTAITCITVACCSYVKINIASVFISTSAVIVAALCTLGAGLLAMSLTGTYFSNFSVSIMILAFPRLLIMSYLAILESLIDIINFNPTDTILDFRLNIVLGTFFNSMTSGEAFYPYEHILPIIYTLVLSLVYLGLGMYFFVKRRSEIATMPATNSNIQMLFRLIPAFAISLIPVALITTIIWGEQEPESYVILSIVVLYVVVVITYFLYELISSRKLRTMFASAKQLWILVLTNIIFLVLIACGRAVILNNVPVASEVSYVKITTDNVNTYDYFKQMCANVKITDPDVIACATNALSDNVDAIKSNSSRRLIHGSIDVQFKVGIRTIQRKLYFDSQEDYEQFKYVLANCDEYIDIYTNLPEYDSLQNINLFSLGQLPLDDSDLREIYECYVEDCKNIPAHELLDINNLSPYEDFAYFSGTYSTFTSNYRFHLDLGKSKKTILMVMNKVNKVTDGNYIRDFLNLDNDNVYTSEDKKNDYTFAQVSFRLITENGKEYSDTARKDFDGETLLIGHNYTENGKKILSEMADILDKSSDNITSLDNPILVITYTPPFSHNTEYSAHYYTVNDEFVELMKIYTGEESLKTRYKD